MLGRDDIVVAIIVDDLPIARLPSPDRAGSVFLWLTIDNHTGVIDPARINVVHASPTIKPGRAGNHGDGPAGLAFGTEQP